MTLYPAGSSRRGLTLLEVMLALAVTALIAGAISGMMGAVTAGVSTRQDTRSTMVSANAAAGRLAAYIVPCRAVLEVDGSDVVVWLHDKRESTTVHATELRWLRYNNTDQTLEVFFVNFPDSWTQAAKDLEDNEYPLGTNWKSVLGTYQSKGWIASLPLVDGLAGITITTDQVQPLDSRHFSFNLSILTSGGSSAVEVAATVRVHEPPTS